MAKPNLLAPGILLLLFVASLLVANAYISQQQACPDAQAAAPAAARPSTAALASALAADERYDMIILLAGASQDISACSELFDIDDKEFCYAMAQNNSEFCSGAQGQGIEWGPTCNAMFARDSGICKSIADSDGADICAWNVAVLLSNPSVCDSLADPDSRDFCIWDVALFTGDVSLCSSIAGSEAFYECEAEVEGLAGLAPAQ